MPNHGPIFSTLVLNTFSSQVGVLHEQTERQSRRIQDLEKMSISSEDFNEIFQEVEINEINQPTTTNNNIMDNVSNNTTGNK